MSWDSPLPEPFSLATGKRLATLRDAADLILKLPAGKQGDDGWAMTAAALMHAADYPFQAQLEKANLALWRVLRSEGLIGEEKKAKARA